MSINCTVKKKRAAFTRLFGCGAMIYGYRCYFGGEILKARVLLFVVARLSGNEPAHFLDNRLVTLVPKVILLHYICL